MSKTSFKGSCLCGAVEYEIRAPFLFFHHCHCSRCRKNSGSAHASNIFIKHDQFGWVKGEEVVQRYELPTAEYYCTAWCSRCGSVMPWVTRNGRFYLVPAGSLDDDPIARPNRNIYWESGAPWYSEVTNLPTFPGDSPG